MDQDWLNSLSIFQPQTTQGAINQAVLSDGTPVSIAAPVMPVMPAANPMPQPMPAPPVMVKPQAPTPKASAQMSDAFKAYLPKPSVGDQVPSYQALSQQALADQQAQLAGLNQYINDIAAKPRGVDLSALAAYVDSTTGSKLYDAVHSAAPMSEDDRDKMLFGLRNQLAASQAKFSADQLKALQEQQQFQQFNRRQQELERHNQAIENKGAGMTDARTMMAQTRQDDQTSKAVDLVTKNQQLNNYVPRIQGADRILGQLQEVKAGNIVDTRQFLNDLNTEYVNLLTGANNSALGKQERTEYSSLASDLSALKQRIEAKPESINSPEILNQLQKSVESLQKTYRSNYDQKADTLRRTYKFNPEANTQLNQKIDEAKSVYGTAGAIDHEPTPAGPHGPSVTQNGHTYFWNAKTGKYE